MRGGVLQNKKTHFFVPKWEYLPSKQGYLTQEELPGVLLDGVSAVVFSYCREGK